MTTKITKVVIEADGTAVIYKKEVRDKLITVIELDKPSRLNEEFRKTLHERGYTHIMFTFAGYGMVKRKDGMWLQVDVHKKKLPEEMNASPSPLCKSDLLGFVIPETEWGAWALQIPVEAKGVFSK